MVCVVPLIELCCRIAASGREWKSLAFNDAVAQYLEMSFTVNEARLQWLWTEIERAHSALVHGLSILDGAPTTTSLADQLLFKANSTPFGNTPGGLACRAAHTEAHGAAKNTLKAFGGTVDGDVERLKLAVGLYLTMDDANAEKFLLSNGNMLDFLSAHLSNLGENNKHSGDQAAQIAKLRGLVSGLENGNVVVSGDFNAKADGDKPSAPEIQNFGPHGFDTDADRIYDGPGGAPRGTSESYNEIDHVLPRGVGTTEAERWDRGESDHDGQRLDITIPAW
ncbi:hypothetical protein [Nocardia sp. NPDC051832]|uniref:hypothetical protein n=1 Tax=Nocardia sp. NPDC051832 TaxID=3155673 RepID=UPI00341FCD9D